MFTKYTNISKCVSHLTTLMENDICYEQMVICCLQLASAWLRSPHFCKVKLTYFVVICQNLTWIWQRRSSLGSDVRGSSSLLSATSAAYILVCRDYFCWGTLGLAPHKKAPNPEDTRTSASLSSWRTAWMSMCSYVSLRFSVCSPLSVQLHCAQS